VKLSLANWRSTHVLGAWGAYWLSLLAVTLGPALIRLWPVISAPNAKGSASANIGDGRATLTVIDAGTTVWTGSASLGAIAFWLTVPPLVLWLLWLIQRPRREAAPTTSTAAVTALAELPRPVAEPVPMHPAEREPVSERRR
jgi:hypothetical protein